MTAQTSPSTNVLDLVTSQIAEMVQPEKESSQPLLWCRPGIPFQPEDLQFAVKGLNGKDAHESATLLRQAAEFARTVNAIPDFQTGIYSSTGSMLWNVYKETLDMSQVANAELPEDMKKKLERLQGLLKVQKKEKDLISDEEKTVLVPSPLVTEYEKYFALYNDAVMQYNTLRLAAMNEVSSEAVQSFAVNGALYKRRVSSAYEEWGAQGRRNEVEKIRAFINQVSAQSMVLVKNNAIKAITDVALTEDSGEFYKTSFYPADFVQSDRGWAGYSFSAKAKNSSGNQSKSGWDVAAHANWGLFSFGADGSHSEAEGSEEFNSDEFSMRFKLAQVPISRPWFSPQFLLSHGWRSVPGAGVNELSSGGDQPTGSLPGYPTSVIFIKDLEIKSSNLGELSSTLESASSGGGQVGWGPFSLGGQYSSEHRKASQKFSFEDNTLKVAGMQIVAMKAFRLPKAPNPSPTIEKWA